MPSLTKLSACLLLLGLCWAGSAYADCTSPAAPAGNVIFNTTYKVMQYCNGTTWINTGAVNAGAAQTGCSGPVAGPGGVVYNKTLGVVQFCNGSSWVDTACAATRSPGGSNCTGGAMRYVGSVNELQFCDSTDWVAMGWPCSGGGGGGGGGSTDWTTLASTQGLTPSVVLGMSGDTALMGNYQGTSYNIWTRTGGVWSSQANLGISTGAIFASNYPVDGNTVLIPNTSDGSGKGAVYVFTGSGASWSQQQKIVPAGLTTASSFGSYIALSGDTLAAVGDEDVYIYTRSGGTWTQQQKISLTGNGQNGLPLALDGDTLAINSIANNTGTRLSGQVYIYTRSGSTWTSVTTITGPTPSGPSTADFFGSILALKGNTLAISAAFDNTKATRAGAVYIFTGSGASWSQQAKLYPADLAAEDNFGINLTLTTDAFAAGATGIISYFNGYTGAPAATSRAYVYSRSGSTWTQAKKLTGTHDGFGIDMAMSGLDLLVTDGNVDGSVTPTTYAYHP